MAEEIAYILDKNRLKAVARETDSDVSDNIFATVLDKTAFSASAIIARFQSGGGGVTLFLELTDTPNSYTGQAGRAAIVNPGETALIFSRMEPYLGVPAADGYVLSSTVAGVRSWVPPGGAGTVASVFGRTGSVVAVSGDYNADQIDDAATTNKFATQAQLNQIATNTGNISTNAAGIANNAANIATNTTDIANNVTAIATKENSLGNPAGNGYLLASTTGGVRSWVDPASIGGVTSVFGRTGVVVATSGDYNADQIDDAATTNKFATQAELDQIATNTGNIATNTSDIADNAADIATNAGNIATNASNIATNTSDIATNASAIATNASNIATNTSNIATNTSDIATNAAAIATNTSDIATNTSDIATNTAAIASIRAITANVSVSSDVTLTNKALHLIDTSAARSLTLPAANANFYLVLKDVTGNAQLNNVTITTPGVETIDGQATYVFDRNYFGVEILSDGTNYFVIPLDAPKVTTIKNLVQSPDDASGIVTTGGVTAVNTATPSELPEPSKGIAARITQSGGAAGDKATWNVNPIDPGDNARIGTNQIYIKTLPGYVDDDATIRWVDATTGDIFGETDIKTTTTYLSGASLAMLAGNDLAPEIEFNVANSSGLVVSGVGTLAQNPLVGSLGGWKIYTNIGLTGSGAAIIISNGSGTTLTTFNMGWLQPVKDPITGAWILNGSLDLSHASDSSVEFNISGISFNLSGGFEVFSHQNPGLITDGRTNSATGVIITRSSPSTRTIINFSLRLTGKPTWADFDDTVPLGSDLEAANAKMTAYGSSTSITTSITDVAWTTVSQGVLTSNITYTIPNDGTYTVNASCAGLTNVNLFDALLNGTTQIANSFSSSDGNGNISATREFSAGDTIKIRARVSSGSDTMGVASFSVTRFSEKSTTIIGFPFSSQATEDDEYLVPRIKKKSGEGDLGTIINWATVDSKKYRWYVVGDICFYEHRVESTTASSSVGVLVYDLPADVPPPKQFSNVGNSEAVLALSSGRHETLTGAPYGSGSIFRDGSGTIQVAGYTDINRITRQWNVSGFWQIDP